MQVQYNGTALERCTHLYDDTQGTSNFTPDKDSMSKALVV